MKDIDWITVLVNMKAVIEKLGTHRSEQVFACLKDIHDAGIKYESEIREAAMQLVFDCMKEKQP